MPWGKWRRNKVELCANCALYGYYYASSNACAGAVIGHWGERRVRTCVHTCADESSSKMKRQSLLLANSQWEIPPLSLSPLTPLPFLSYLSSAWRAIDWLHLAARVHRRPPTSDWLVVVDRTL